MKVEILVIGAGPTGLGAACRLNEHGMDWHMCDAEPHFGGLASSWIDKNGFTWDHGGHVQFSHYETFDRYMIEALGEEGWLQHQRESWVWIKNRFVPYPFQNNLHRLDPADRWAAVEGLMQAAKAAGGSKPRDFEQWMMATFGEGITQLFMHPYNFKVWAFPPREMDYGWIGERVSVPPINAVLQSVCTGRDAVSWGPNATFMFPKHGGTGGVWQAIGKMLPEERVSLSNKITAIDPVAMTATDQHGQIISYKHLISTIPLDSLVKIAPGIVDVGQAEKLVYSSTNIVGVGMRGQVPEHLKTKCWMYFPDSNSPYYRVTVFSNYSPNNVPKPGEQWSLMTETSESTAKPVNYDTLVDETIQALREDQLLPPDVEIETTTYRRIQQGYPTPFIGRDDIVDPALRAFEAVNIYSRGRFGAWKYEVANQDHSFAQGYECVERIRQGGGAELEPTLHDPGLVNTRRNS